MNTLHFRALSLGLLLSFLPLDLGGQAQSSLSLLPIPKSLVRLEGSFTLDASLRVRLTGHKDLLVTTAVIRTLQRLERKTGIPFPPSTLTDSNSAAFEIHCDKAGEPTPSIRADESYRLEITDQGARLEAPSPAGVLRGLETFLQLVDLNGRSFILPAVRIEDAPRFCWRGLHLDVSRHWIPADGIKRNLDAMAAVKMNVFHWHLSDDQGFRMESRVFPKLHLLGSDGNYYTQAEVRDIIAYARDRGIRVIPEFDMPGHATAILVAYPELASAPGPYAIERYWGVFAPTLDPTSKKLYEFLDAFIAEMAGIFPDDYFHIGGDEVNPKQWNANPRIQAFKARNGLKDNAALQAYFNRQLQKILSRHGRKMIGWDEVLHPDLPQSVVVQSWRGHSHLAKAVRQGHTGMLSHGYYLDAMRPASFHYAIDPLDKEVAALSDEEKSRVLGGEACMWAEFVTQDNVESRIWPRTAAIAERLWSPRDIRDTRDMYRRLDAVSSELETFGLMHRIRPAKMLRRMAADEHIEPLQIFAAILTPTSLSVRRKIQPYSSLVPLNRMVDAVQPESDAARRLAELVENALADSSGTPDSFRPVRKHLSRLQDNAQELHPILDRSYLLKELIPVSDIVTRLCAKGLEALTYLETKQRPAEEWKEETAGLLEQAGKPQAEMMIAITPSIQRLIEAANAL
ncbi:MAG: family 20 glycosylhydrolase [Acidobacteriota bacterium]|nr:family 20 glycosylhydrolase [Acidobacteriota bacterium]